jgi:hypothetical protein|tara:strand:+ start:327 stop:815 length:489 start_codon:yes stop_codon:yes gene_type:complete
MLPTIQIKDNFLDQKELKILINNIDKIQYLPIRNEFGNFGFRHNFDESLDNEWLFKKIKKQFFPNENLKVDNSSYHLRHNSKKVLEHEDDNDYNFLLYLKGKELVYNGTGFYHKNNLHTYIGFVENRALFFDGKNNLHTDLQALGESSPRYSINIFYNKKYG